MFRHFVQQVVNFFGDAYALPAIVLIPLGVLLTLLLLGSGPWWERIARLGAAPGRWSLLALLAVNALRWLTGGALVGLLAAFLLVQAGLFAERHGRVTQRNYEAVKSKWGVPHEQRELRVDYRIWELVTSEDFADGGRRVVVEPLPDLPAAERCEKTLSDETFEVAVDEKGNLLQPRAVARRVVERRERSLGGGGVETADIDLEIRSTPRYLGGAGYAGFEDACRFRYLIVNPHDVATDARFRFPLPAEGYGLFNRLSVSVGGAALEEGLSFEEGALAWTRTLAAHESLPVEISYESRGLSHFRYWPGSLRRRCVVALRVRGIPPERLNFPIGSMSPDTDLQGLKGEDYTLRWDLSRAVTNFSIGVIIPSPPQPGYATERLLREAPLGLALLAGVLIASRLLLGAGGDLLPLALALSAHYLGYATTAHLSESLGSFALAFALGIGLSALLAALFWIRREGGGRAGWHAAGLQLAYGAGYPLAVWAEAMTGSLLHGLYLLTAGYFMLLAIRQRRTAIAEEEGRAEGKGNRKTPDTREATAGEKS